MACSPYCFLSGLWLQHYHNCLSNKNIQNFYSNLNEEQKELKMKYNGKNENLYYWNIIWMCKCNFILQLDKNKAKLCILLSIILTNIFTTYFSKNYIWFLIW